MPLTRRIPPIASATICALLVGSAAAQRTWTVDATGNGDFRTLASAYTAARPGDTIRVRNGTYVPATTGKGVTVLCEPNAEFVPRAGTSAELRVWNLPRGQRFVWRGGRMRQTPGSIATFLIDGCDGAVVIDGLDCSAGPFAAQKIFRSGQVSVRNSWFVQLEVLGGHVNLSDCVLVGLDRPALQAHSSDVSVARCIVSTARTSGGTTAPGLELLVGTTARLAGGTLIQGARGPAIRGDLGSTVLFDPSVRLESVGALVQGPAVVLPVPIASTTPLVTPDGTRVVAASFGQPGSLMATSVSWPTFPTALPFGMLWTDPRSPVGDAGLVGGDGVRVFGFAVGAMRGVPLVLQPVSLLTSGAVALGAPTVVVLD